MKRIIIAAGALLGLAGCVTDDGYYGDSYYYGGSPAYYAGGAPYYGRTTTYVDRRPVYYVDQRGNRDRRDHGRWERDRGRDRDRDRDRDRSRWERDRERERDRDRDRRVRDRDRGRDNDRWHRREPERASGPDGRGRVAEPVGRRLNQAIDRVRDQGSE